MKATVLRNQTIVSTALKMLTVLGAAKHKVAKPKILLFATQKSQAK